MTRLTAVCLTHRNAPLEVLEQFPRHDSLRATLDAVRRIPNVRGCLVLSTCNRFEVYLSSDGVVSTGDLVTAISPAVSLPASHWVDLLERDDGDAAVRHLFAVAGGLHSRLVGEHEILGQVRAAAHAAAQAGSLDIHLATLIQWAVRAGRRARRALGAAGSDTSVADHGINVVRTLLGDLAGRRVLVIGAGHLASRATRLLTSAGATTIVCARNVDKARAAREASSVLPIELLPLLPGTVDAVVCATSARRPLINAAMLRTTVRRSTARPLLLIDLGVPRNVDGDVSLLDDVVCLDLDALARLDTSGVDHSHRAAAHDVIDAEVEAFARAQSERAVAGLLEHVTERAQRIRESELNRVAGRIGGSELAAVDEVTRRVINKLLHPIVTGIKAAVIAGDADLARAAAAILCGKDSAALGDHERQSQAS